MKRLLFVIAFLFSIAACTTDESASSATSAENSPSVASTVALPVIIHSAESELQITDIAPIPNSFPNNVRNLFDRYTQVIPPNGKPITLYAQNEISDVQIIQARNTLLFFLTDVPDTAYGRDKQAVANQMGTNEAILLLMNGTHGEQPEANINGQPLHATELMVPGAPGYINNDYENNRDATFEEIFHLVHDTGIGVDGANTTPGALPAYQTQIRAATNNAIANDFQIWPIGASTDRDTKRWFNELKRENSLSQEYIAAVLDSYYGLWGAFEETNAGMWGMYAAKTRADIAAEDPLGYALMTDFLSPYLTYNALLDPSFDGTFTMTFDPAVQYTHKSQYLLHATLTGDNHANLTGNDQDNTLAGNSGDNIIDGADGHDTVQYPNAEGSYSVTHREDGTILVVGDGTDTLINVEALTFDGASAEAPAQ